MSKRETVELVTGEVFFSDDHWATVWRLKGPPGQAFEVRNKATANLVRYIALVQHGGGRDEVAS